MKIKLLAGPALAALIAATPVLAQDAPPPPPPGHDGPGRHAPPLTRAEVETKVAERFAKLDLNHDGMLTRGEIVDARHAMREQRIKERRNAMFDRLDTNKDGKISRDEFDTAPPHGPEGAGPPPGGPGGPGMKGPYGPIHGRDGLGGPGMIEGLAGPHWFERADTNHDDKVTLAEAKAAALALFDRLDTNHDGVLGPEERRAAMRTMFERGHGWGPKGHRGPGGPDGAPPPQE